MILEVARKAGHTPVATFDREFGKFGKIPRTRLSAVLAGIDVVLGRGTPS
jgi:hypothetical protein